MKIFFTLALFVLFLLIRSGNSHEVIIHSDRPAISAMQHRAYHTLSTDASSSHHLKFKKKGPSNRAEILMEKDSDDFQSWEDYQLQMAFFACLTVFTFFLIFWRKTLQNLNVYLFDNNPNPIFISQRSLRI